MRETSEQEPRPAAHVPSRAATQNAEVREVLDLQDRAGNRAVSGLLAPGAGGAGPGHLQRLATAAPILQRQPTPVLQRAVPSPLLAVDSRGPDVAELQRALNDARVVDPPLVADGAFGAATGRAVRAFQRRAGIAADGIVGPDTRNALSMGGGRPSTPEQQGELATRIATAGGAQVPAEAAAQAAGRPGSAGGDSASVSVGDARAGGAASYDAASGAVHGEAHDRQGDAASGDYNVDTGSGSGSVSVHGNAASGSYDAATGQAHGAVSDRHGDSASGDYNVNTGSGSGSVSVNGTSASGSYDAGTGVASGGVSTSTGAGPVAATGSYDTNTGSWSAAGSTSGGGAAAAWDNQTRTASGAYTSTSGTSASGTVNVDAGTGAGSVHTSYGDAAVSVTDTTVHASVNVPGYGNVDVNVDRPDWL